VTTKLTHNLYRMVWEGQGKGFAIFLAP